MKMYSRIFSVLLLITFLGSYTISVSGAEIEKALNLVANGSFESIMGNGMPEGWWFSPNGVFGTDYQVVKNNMDGTNCLKVAKDAIPSGSCHIAQNVTGLYGGAEYTLTASLKSISVIGRGITVLTEFYSSIDASIHGTLVKEEKSITDVRVGKWQTIKIDFTAPEDVAMMAVAFRLYGGGEIYWDDISLVCNTEEYKDRRNETELQRRIREKTYEIKEPIPGEEERVQNKRFEVLNSSGNPEGWNAYGTWGGGFVTLEKGAGRENGNCVRISGGSNPWVSTVVPDVKEGYEYQLSAWVKIDEIVKGRGFGFKAEGYKANEINAETGITDPEANIVPGYVQSTNNGWKHVSYRFVIPKGLGIKAMAVYARVYGTGTVYVDEVSFYITNDTRKEPFTFMTDNIFYYSDRTENGTAAVDGNFEAYPEFLDATVDFGFYDGEKVLKEEKNIPFTKDTYKFGKAIQNNSEAVKTRYAAKTAVFEYPMKLFAEKQKEYLVTVVVKEKNGNVLREYTQKVSKYDRPTRLDKNGIYLKDGKPFVPVVGYHVDIEEWNRCKEAGINTVIISYWYFDANYPERLEKALAELEKNDLMGVPALYLGMAPAGSVTNYDNTEKIIKKLKNHPRILGYSVMDEPSLMFEYDNDLYYSYRLIRGIDPDIPVYIVDCIEDLLESTARYTDISLCDPYPTARKEVEVTTFPGLWTKLVQESVKYDKPAYDVLQSYEGEFFTPNGDEIRHMYYQALFRGATGMGYYSISDALGIYINKEKGVRTLVDTELWKEMCEFASWEMEEAHKAFILKEYTTIGEKMGNEAWYKLYEGEDGLYLVILSQSDTESVTVDVPLENFDGSIKIGDFTARLAAGGKGEISGNHILTHTLLPRQAALYKITPSDTTDFSGMTNGRFMDLGEHSWARAQIEALDKLGIVNENSAVSFAPGRNITRADFAYFLVRTLGLTAEGGENFADVDGDKYYAKELSTGRALGILEGVGDNKFAPEASITRQDLMKITARALKLTDTNTDLSMFSDSNQIADYAIESVKAMIASKLVAGNADGTLNPTGSATRAEAAVIMYRIRKG